MPVPEPIRHDPVVSPFPAWESLAPDQRSALEVYSSSMAPGSEMDFRRFIARQAVIFTESAALSATFARQSEALPTELVSSLNDTELFWRGIAAEFGLLTSLEVAQALGASANRSYASELRKAGRIVALRRLNKFVYPGFQFADGSVRDVIADLTALGREYDLGERDIVAWLCRPTTFFGASADRPVDHLDDAELVLSAATSAWGATW